MIEDARLNVFLAVADNGSFTMAARQLGISQPAVSQHIAELERQLSTVLFERGAGKVSLTEAGRVFQDYAQAIRRSYDAVNGLFNPASLLGEGLPVTVAATTFAASYLLPQILERVTAVSGRQFIMKTYPETAFSGDLPKADVLVFTAQEEGGPGETVASLTSSSGLKLYVRFVAGGLFAGTALCDCLRGALNRGC